MTPYLSRMQNQFQFPGFKKLNTKNFGGTLLKGNPRDARPISLKRPMHLVMRSTMATGNRSFLKPHRARMVQSIIHRVAVRKGVKVYRIANSGNHLHLILLPQSRRSYAAFIRAISGLIARITLGAERGSALGQKFWDARPFTRILDWGRDYRGVCAYLLQNTLESIGFVDYRPRMRTKPKNPE